MQLTDIPTEQTTAATDVLLALVAFGCVACLLGLRRADPWKVGLWAWAFGLLGAASLLGAAVHGLQMSPEANRLLWQPLHLSLGLVVALFVAGAVHDLAGRRASRRALPALLAVALAFFAVTQAFRGAFVVFVLYEAAAMLLALAIYARLAATGRLPGAWWMVAGVLISLAAAAVQTRREVRFTLVWEFDHNGAFHLVQVPGLLAMLAGLRAAMLRAHRCVAGKEL